MLAITARPLRQSSASLMDDHCPSYFRFSCLRLSARLTYTNFARAQARANVAVLLQCIIHCLCEHEMGKTNTMKEDIT